MLLMSYNGHMQFIIFQSRIDILCLFFVTSLETSDSLSKNIYNTTKIFKNASKRQITSEISP